MEISPLKILISFSTPIHKTTSIYTEIQCSRKDVSAQCSGPTARALPYAPTYCTHLCLLAALADRTQFLHTSKSNTTEKNSEAVISAFSLAQGCISRTIKSFPISLLLTTNTIPKCSIFNIHMPTEPSYVTDLTEKFLYVCKGVLPARPHSLFFPTSKAVIFVYYEDSHLS